MFQETFGTFELPQLGYATAYVVYELPYLKESVHEANLLTTETVTDGASIALVSTFLATGYII